tara:strand:- start:8508 stop:10358 length:1851 start_codon:yes stop_codon:yes gene_type:complete
MTVVRGSVAWGQVPLWFAGSEMATQQPSYGANYIVSANSEMRYQIIWTATSANEMYIPHVEGDIVNAIFNVFATTDYPRPALFSDWDLIGTIKKSRDLPNTDIVTSTVPNTQRFTIDVSRLVADQLSYSLCPIGKGSWQSQAYGGMNGGPRKQDNITENVSPYNVTRNGSYRAIAVTVGYEVLDVNLQIVDSSTTTSAASKVVAINSVNNLSQSNYYYYSYNLSRWSVSQTRQYRALTRCPNTAYTTGLGGGVIKKEVSIDDQAEFLQFFVRRSGNGSYPLEPMNVYEMFGETYNDAGVLQDEFVLGSTWPYPINNDPTNIGERIQSDISHNFAYNSDPAMGSTTNDTQLNDYQNQTTVQNVSPGYINAHAYPPQLAVYPYTGAPLSPIDDDVAYYCVYIRAVFYDNPGVIWRTMRKSNLYYYKINREDDQLPYENVRFHWLNSLGGIDSYTARRDVLESISLEKTLMKNARANKRYPQDEASIAGALTIKDYYSDTMRGYDTYKGGLEVLNVNTNINNTVYTEPLNKVTATWLREMFSSPNVWIEKKDAESDQTEYKQDFPYLMNEVNPDLRPQPIIYAPVIINNTEIVSLDQKEGLVMYNIEYTDSYGVVGQSN